MKASETDNQKQLPHDIEAERFILGSIIIDNDVLHWVIELLEPEDFYKKSHQRLYSAMIRLFERGSIIDTVTLTEYLKTVGKLEKAGGILYLSRLTDIVVSPSYIQHYAKVIKQKSLLRSMAHAVSSFTSKAFENSYNADEIIDYAERTILEIKNKNTKKTLVKIKNIVEDTIKAVGDKKYTISGISTGFKELDKIIAGLQPGDLIVVGGRPGTGKTAFVLNIAKHVSFSLREPIAIFSLEMSKEQLAMRMLCAESMLDASLIKKGIIGKNDWPKLIDATKKLTESLIFIDDSLTTTAIDIRAKSRRLKMEQGGLCLIIIDYLQLLRSSSNFERREREISDISRGLKALAKELEVPVIAVSQLNRAVEQRPGKKPTLADLRESGAIEQDADLVILLSKNQPEDKVELTVAKNRNGPTGTLNLTYLAGSTKFVP